MSSEITDASDEQPSEKMTSANLTTYEPVSDDTTCQKEIQELLEQPVVAVDEKVIGHGRTESVILPQKLTSASFTSYEPVSDDTKCQKLQDLLEQPVVTADEENMKHSRTESIFLPQKTTTSKLTTYKIISDAKECQKEVQELLEQPVVAVDVEGVNLSRTGPITLLQVATVSGHVIIFDVYSQGCPDSSMFGEECLRLLLESSRVLKVMHGCSQDSDALYHQHDVLLENVYDTQVAEMLIEHHRGRLLPKREKLCDIIKRYQGNLQDLSEKDSVRNKWETEDAEYWARRPLTPEMISYAISDVRVLIPEVHEKQFSLIQQLNLVPALQQTIHEELRLSWDREICNRRDKQMKESVRTVIRQFQAKHPQGLRLHQLEDDDVLQALSSKLEEEFFHEYPAFEQLRIEFLRKFISEVHVAVEREGASYARASKIIGFLHFLAHVTHHEAIREESKPLLARVRDIVLVQLEKKYSTTTPAEHVRENDLKFVIHLPPDSLSHSPILKRLYMLAQKTLYSDSVY